MSINDDDNEVNNPTPPPPAPAKPKRRKGLPLGEVSSDRVAGQFLTEFHTVGGRRTLHFYKGDFWTYTGTYYEKHDESDLKSTFHAHFVAACESQGFFPKSDGLKAAAWSALKARATLSGVREMPSWLTLGEALRGQVDYGHIAFTNGILTLRSKVLQEHTNEWFSPTCLPFDYDPAATAPQWLTFLNEVFESDSERITLLQEWFGYCLTPDTSRHKFMIFEGVAGAGKGTVAGVLVALLGKHNCSSIRLEMFSDKFQLRQTVGKLLNVVDETDKVERFQEGIFKAFTSATPQFFDVKNKDGFDAVPTARVLIIANERPPIADKSDGMWRRMLGPLSFRVKPLREDRTLLTRFVGELPGVFNWALAGHDALAQQDEFTLPALAAREKAQYKKDSNPARAWLSENFVVCAPEMDAVDAEGVLVTRQSLYDRYLKHCKDEGHRYPLSMTSFNREVRVAFVAASEHRPRVAGERPRVWRGFKELTE